MDCRLPGSSVHELQGKPTRYILVPYFPICMSSWSFYYDHDAYEPSITVPHQLLNIILFFYCSGFCHTLKWNSHGFTSVCFLILFLISSSHFPTVWLHMVHWLPQSQRAVFTTHGYSMLTMAQSGTPLRTGQGELGLQTCFCLCRWSQFSHPVSPFGLHSHWHHWINFWDESGRLNRVP